MIATLRKQFNRRFVERIDEPIFFLPNFRKFPAFAKILSTALWFQILGFVALRILREEGIKGEFDVKFEAVKHDDNAMSDSFF